MILVFFPIGILVPAIVGWLMLDVLEGKTKVLWRGEKWTLGFLLGTTASMFAVFLAHELLGMPIALWSFATVMGGLIVILALPWALWRKKSTTTQRPYGPATDDFPRWMRIAIAGWAAWIGIRLLAFCVTVLHTPSFFDDTMDNWNMRAKMYLNDHAITLTDSGISSYPPTVPLAKTWLATLAGGWNEGLVNGIHLVWFAAAIFIVFWTLRRRLAFWWSLLGTLLYVSLPLVFIQGTGAYADVFLSAHLAAAVALLWNAATAETREKTTAFFRLAGFAVALVPFTKNEGWALYFPVLLILCAGTAWHVWRKRILSRKELVTVTAVVAILCLAFVGPWIGFKLLNGLAFGNAKGIDFDFRWQPGVVTAIVVNTFLEGNWNFLFVLFFGLLIARRKAILRSPLLLPAAFFAIPYFGQLFFYLFTGLSQEALFQTGYARGLIHLVPVVAMLTTILVHDTVTKPQPFAAAGK